MNKTATILTVFFLVFGFQLGLGQREPAPGTTVDYNTISMPESPTASAFNAVGKTKVNTATGIPSISIPLYTYELDGVKVPIAISYNAAGVKVGDMATPVGLNWSLEAGGQISRTVRGKTDEWEGWLSSNDTYLPDSWYASYNPSNPNVWQDAMKGRADNYYYGYAKTRDHNPDLFSYSFPGGSGAYIHTPSGTILKEKQDGITISPLSDGSSEVSLSAEDLQGNSYSFDIEDVEQSSNEMITSSNWDLTEDFFSWEGENGFDPITAWKLSKIHTKNNKDIHFEYQNEAMLYTLNGTSYHVSIGYGCEVTVPPQIIKAWNKTNTTYDYNTRLIKRIWSPDSHIEVNFNYTSDTGLPDTVWKTKLTSIVVSDQISGRVKEYRFTYDRFDGDPRLKLTGVQEVGYDDTNNEVYKPPYGFDYNTTSLPGKDSHKEDFFGYYNNASGYGLVPELEVQSTFQGFFDSHSNDRSLNANFIQAGILTGITYPTGGQTHFEYEPNAIGDKYCGGLRVKSIEDTDETGTYHRKTYQYSDLKGFNLEDNIGLIMKTEGETTSYHSNFVTLPGDQISSYKTGYFYENVTVTSFDGTENFKEEITYEENLSALHRFDYALKSQTSFEGTQPVKLVEYVNELVGTPQTISWNVLGDMMCYGSNPVKLGYSDSPRVVRYSGNYAYMPTKVATTQYLKRGSTLKPVTTYKEVVYDAQTLLKEQEITDSRRTRNGYDDYPVTEADEERTTVTYTYPWDPAINLNLPAALPMKIAVVSLQENNSKISGQDFEYDGDGNIKRTFQYNKGEGSNSSSLPYIESDYEHMSTFQFAGGKPVQALQKDGVPVSYIWGYKGQLPVAKIEGKLYNGINPSLITAIHTASDSGNETSLLTALENLRTTLAGEEVMITTYTHHPLAGVHTITDPKGDTTTYHYDAFGRLLYVTDKQGRRLKENEYNYGQ